MIKVDSLKTSAAFNGHIFRVEGITPVNANSLLYSYGSGYANETTQGFLKVSRMAFLSRSSVKARYTTTDRKVTSAADTGDAKFNR